MFTQIWCVKSLKVTHCMDTNGHKVILEPIPATWQPGSYSVQSPKGVLKQSEKIHNFNFNAHIVHRSQ